MNVTVVCSDPAHPIFPHLRNWCDSKKTVRAELLNDPTEAMGGDLLLLISCAKIVPESVRLRYRASLVIHASDLPEGRGWSPLIWQILEGRQAVVVSLLEAADPVDSGSIWEKRILNFNGNELYDEINDALFRVELELMDYAVDNIYSINPHPQDNRAATWYPRRTREDSRIDPYLSISEQFDLLRVADPNRYPAFFDYRGRRFKISIQRMSEDE